MYDREQELNSLRSPSSEPIVSAFLIKSEDNEPKISWELIKAVQRDDREAVDEMTKSGHQVDLKLSGETLMHYACAATSSCSKSLLEHLWRCGYPIGLENFYGATPLRIAIRNNNINLSNCLITMGETLTDNMENPFL